MRRTITVSVRVQVEVECYCSRDRDGVHVEGAELPSDQASVWAVWEAVQAAVNEIPEPDLAGAVAMKEVCVG